MTVVSHHDLSYEEKPARRSANPWAAAGPGESSARLAVLEPVRQRSPHRHPNSEEVFYVAQGRGQVWIDGVTYLLEPGSWVRIPADTPHATLAGERMTLVCFFPHHDLEENIEELETVLDGLQEESS